MMNYIKESQRIVLLFVNVVITSFFASNIYGVEREDDIIKRVYINISLDSLSNIQNNRLARGNYEDYWMFEDTRLNYIAQLNGTLSIEYCEAVGGNAYLAASVHYVDYVLKYGLEYEGLANRLNLTNTCNHALAMGAISWAYLNQHNFDKSIEYGYKEVEANKLARAANDPDMLAAYDELRLKLFYSGRIKEAISLCEEQLSSLRHNDIIDNELNFNIRSFLCEMYFLIEDYNQAYNTISIYVGDNQDTSYKKYAYRMMGNYYYLINDIERSINWYNKCLHISRNDKFEMGCCYEGLANCYMREGNIAKYNSYTLLGNKLLKEVLEPTNWDIVESNKNLVNMYEGLGDIDKAIEVMKDSYKIAQTGWLTGSHRHIEIADRFIKLLIKAGAYERASQIIAEIKPYVAQIYGVHSNNYVGLIISEAECLHYLGHSLMAKVCLENIDIYSEEYDNRLCYNYFNILSCVAVQLNDASMAKRAIEKMQPIAESLTGIDKNLSLAYIGYIYYLLGDYDKSAEIYREIVKAVCNNGFGYLLNYSPKYQLSAWTKYLHTLKREIPHVGNLICKETVFTDVIYDALTFSKGLLYSSEQMWKRVIKESGDEELVSMMYRMLQLNEKILKADLKESLESEKHELLGLQLKLSSYVKENISHYENIFTSVTDIQKHLKQTDICIEFSCYRNEIGEWEFCALLLNNVIKHPILIKLCKKSQIESLSPDLIYSDNQLWHLIWEKLEPYMENVENVYFSADDILNTIAIEYILDPNHNIMSERFNMNRLTSTSEILNKNKRDDNHIVALGGLDYETNVSDEIADIVEYNPTVRSALMGYRRFSPLPGSKNEVEEIASLFDSSGRKSVLITGNKGTVDYFESLSGKKYDILHIATHGFYIINDSIQYDSDKLLLQTGLVFSGVNSMTPDDIKAEKTYMTSLDISSLDFSQIGFVVLSACQTGLGDIAEDGVFGLQRGFKKAGVNSILMSLWNVDDEATQILMTNFYKKYLGGMSKHDALRAAQKTVREIPGFEDPEYWAAFILLDALN